MNLFRILLLLGSQCLAQPGTARQGCIWASDKFFITLFSSEAALTVRETFWYI